MSEFTSEFKVGRPYVVVLAKVRPTREVRVRKALAEYLPGAHFFFLWGRCNLMAIAEVADYECLANIGNIPDIERIHHAVCFDWRDEVDQSLVQFGPNPLAFVTHLKLDNQLLQAHGHLLEQRAIRAIRRGLVEVAADAGGDSISWGIFGSLGLHEIIVVVQGQDYGVMKDIPIRRIWPLKTSDLQGFPSEPDAVRAVFARCYTLTGFDADCLEEVGGPKAKAGDPDKKDLLFRIRDFEVARLIGGVVDPRILLQARCGQALGVHAAANETFGSWAPVVSERVGSDDIEVSFQAPGGIPTPQFLEAFYGRFYRDVGPYVYALETDFRFGPMQEGAAFLKVDEGGATYRVEQPEALASVPLPAAARNMARSVYAIYNHAVSDPVLYPYMIDLRGAVRRISEAVAGLAGETKEVDRGEVAAEIERVGRSFLEGYRQRYGNPDGLVSDLDAFEVEFRGGIQRYILAVEAPLNAVFEQFGVSPSSFPLFSAPLPPGQDGHGVLRVPPSRLHRVEDLWMVFHEVGVEFAHTYRVRAHGRRTPVQVIDDVVRVGMERAFIKGIKRRRKDDWVECRRFVIDLFCDLFVFNFVYKRETELYLRTFGRRYLGQERAADTGRGASGLYLPFFQVLFVILFEHVVNQRLTAIDKKKFIYYLAQEDGFQEIVALIGQYVSEPRVVDYEREFKPFKDFALPMVIELFKLIMGLNDEMQSRLGINAEGFQKAEAGQIVYNLENPNQLLLELWIHVFKLGRAQPASAPDALRARLFPARTATILNLWDLALRQQRERWARVERIKAEAEAKVRDSRLRSRPRTPGAVLGTAGRKR